MEQSIAATIGLPSRIARALIWTISYAGVLFAYGIWLAAPLWISLPLCWLVPPFCYYLATPIAAAFRLWSYLSGYLLLYRATRAVCAAPRDLVRCHLAAAAVPAFRRAAVGDDAAGVVRRSPTVL